MRHSLLILSLALSVASLARDPAQLKADLDAVKPSGCTSIRMAYIKSADGFQAFSMYCVNSVVWGVSSDDPTPHRIYPATGVAYCFNVNLTADGRRVIIWDKNRSQMVVANWDGTGTPKTTNVNGQVTEYWHASDGSDWAVVNNQSTVVDLINIDSTSKVRHINMGVGSQSAPVNVSDDGNAVLVQGDGNFGLWDIKQNKYFPGPNGCQPSLRAGTPYQWNLNPSGHHSMQVMNADGSLYKKYFTADSASKYVSSKGQGGSCQAGDGLTQEGTRFTQHPDFATFFLSNSKANPILCRLSDMRTVYVEDNLACNFVGDMDAVFLGTSVPTRQSPAAPSAKLTRAAGPQLTYSIQGRRVERDRINGIGVECGKNGAIALRRIMRGR